MEGTSAAPIHRTSTETMGSKMIMRRSVHRFLQYYDYLTTTSAILAIPFSVSVLISMSLVPRSSFTLLPTIYFRLSALFSAATSGYFSHPTSQFIVFINLKLSQTICSWILTLPFALSFYLLAKASVIHHFFNREQPTGLRFSSLFETYSRILHTHICNVFVLFSANSTCFALLFCTFNLLERLNLLSHSVIICFTVGITVVYSIVLANTLMICNLALITSGMERRTKGFLAILKGLVIIKGKTSTALALAFPINIGLALLESLFNFRIVSSNFSNYDSDHHGNNGYFAALEGLLIAYLYCILLVLDVIMSCYFYQSCKEDCNGRIIHDVEESKGRALRHVLETEQEYSSDPKKLQVL